jgi:hypothetical protein
MKTMKTRRRGLALRERLTNLRACLVKVRVRMVLYTFSYEKAVSDRPFRH